MGNEEILREVKRIILGVTVIRVLRNSDINVIMLNEASKDKAHGLPLTEALKIYKKDYLIEVLSVPLSVRVTCKKGMNNTHLVTVIYEASRTISPSL
jgi:predicted permease